MFENSETRKIFQHKRKELSDWRIQHNEELRGLYFLPIRWAGHVARLEGEKNAYKVFVRKFE